MVKALDRKLLRDAWQLRGQLLTIVLVVACGIASFVTFDSAYRSLEWGRDRYYVANRFGDVFASLKRAPDGIAARLEEAPGVALVHPREVERVMLPLEDLPEPAVGKIIALPRGAEPPLSAPYMRDGRMMTPGRLDEVVLLDSFAKAHHLGPGSTVPAVLNGVRRELRVVGTALSPEFVFAVAEGSPIADPARFAVLWMDRDVVAPAFQMEGAFNDVVVRLQPGASERAVCDALDRVLARYGGRGAYGRREQISNHVLTGELDQLRRFAIVVPAIFLGVAAFLLNVVLTRLLHLQRPQIATLKAVGYRNGEIAAHYAKLVSIVVVLGSALGTALGALLGRGMMVLYEPYFRYPDYQYRLETRTIVTATLVAGGAAFLGAFTSVRRAVNIAPAEAMRPDSPPSYRASILERMGVGRLLGTSGRMVLRELSRHPTRTILSAFGIALAIGIVITSRFQNDAFETIIDVEFERAARDDVSVSFLRPVPDDVRREIEQLPGVLASEPMRAVPVRLRAGHKWRELALVGQPADARLKRVIEFPVREVPMPERGVVLTDKLADVLSVRPGDHLQVEVLEGDRITRDVVVAGLAREMFGLQAHMALPALHDLLGEDDGISGVLLRVDPRSEAELERRLKDMPLVANVTRRRATIELFRKQSGESSSVTTLVLTIFAATIAIGVVYNDARIALSLRSRDLASLRVLGFTRAEISAVLLGELATYVVLAIPVGILVGRVLTRLIVSMADPETYRIPAVIGNASYAMGMTITVIAALFSALLVRRQLDRLDLIAVLKTRE
jgi:putative ABC transport system permease protein